MIHLPRQLQFTLLVLTLMIVLIPFVVGIVNGNHLPSRAILIRPLMPMVGLIKLRPAERVPYNRVMAVVLVILRTRFAGHRGFLAPKTALKLTLRHLA